MTVVARQQRLEASGYTAPHERPGCWKCRHLAQTRGKQLRCLLHKIYVHKLGTCPNFVEDPKR